MTDTSIDTTESTEAIEAEDLALTDLPLEEIFELLKGAARRKRQDASHALASIAKSDPTKLSSHIDALIDALYRPEAQTRWEVLDCLTSLVEVDADAMDPAFAGAEDSLFDEGSGKVRLGSFRFIAHLGATSPKRSQDAWTLLDEGIQCFHGDPEYREMLASLVVFAKGDIAPEVRAALVERIAFDAENGHGYIGMYSADITNICKDAKSENKPAKKAKKAKAAAKPAKAEKADEAQDKPKKKTTKKAAKKSDDEAADDAE